MPEPNSGCLLWTGGVGSHGYGVFSYAGQPGLTAHRASWQVCRGPIPTGLHVLHKCDVRSCINPDHLFLGTHADNMADMTAKGYRKARALRGEESNFSKLTGAQVRAIRADERPTKIIAASFAVSKSLVHQIRARLIWKHLP
jgi:hypothetical protein